MAPFLRHIARTTLTAARRPLTMGVLTALLGHCLIGEEPPGTSASGLSVTLDPATGQVGMAEGSRPILQYNFQTIEPGHIVDRIADDNRIYARARSDYIHPLYGLNGEILTRDWSIDHPHHRGIYWAWPEVEFDGERGDLHALQRVFARPLGEVRWTVAPDFAEVVAENLWMWEDRVPIVRESVALGVFPEDRHGRCVDLTFRFSGLVDGVTIARRETRLYGGLNLRLAGGADQQITVHTDDADTIPRRAWSDVSARFDGETFSGLTLLQHRDNPMYPGDWIQYPELSWCQPAFPAAGTRYALPLGQPLVLRYRLWIHQGHGPTPERAAALWDHYHSGSNTFTQPANDSSSGRASGNSLSP